MRQAQNYAGRCAGRLAVGAIDRIRSDAVWPPTYRAVCVEVDGAKELQLTRMDIGTSEEVAANTSQSTTTSFAMVCALQLASKNMGVLGGATKGTQTLLGLWVQGSPGLQWASAVALQLRRGDFGMPVHEAASNSAEFGATDAVPGWERPTSSRRDQRVI